MSLGPWQILIIGVVVVLLFGRGKISGIMAEVAQGIKGFKKGMAEDDTADKAKDAAKTIEHEAKEAADAVAAEKSNAS